MTPEIEPPARAPTVIVAVLLSALPQVLLIRTQKLVVTVKGEVVKLLTMITVITTPLMIVGTWYGMNFQNMPELKWQYGYELAIVITIVSTAATYWWFKKKHWF